MRKSFNLPIYNFKVYLYVGAEEKVNYCKALNIDMEKATMFDGICTGTYVYIEDKKDFSIVAHEFYHLIYTVKKLCGIDDEESEAYIMTFLMDWYIKNVYNEKKKRKVVKKDKEKKEDGRA